MLMMERNFFLQDPYFKITLHDGKIADGPEHVGESVQTTQKDNAGGTATFNEKFAIKNPSKEHKSWTFVQRSFMF